MTHVFWKKSGKRLVTFDTGIALDIERSTFNAELSTPELKWGGISPPSRKVAKMILLKKPVWTAGPPAFRNRNIWKSAGREVPQPCGPPRVQHDPRKGDTAGSAAVPCFAGIRAHSCEFVAKKCHNSDVSQFGR